MMKILRLFLLAGASLMLFSCTTVIPIVSLELRTLDFKKADDASVEQMGRTVKTKYPFTAIELDGSDSITVSAGKSVKILAQQAPDFTDLTFKKPTRLLAYRPDIKSLIELPDGKRFWAILPEASIGLKAFCLETKDTVLISDVVRTSKAQRDSRYKYLYNAGGKSYTFEELGWGLKGQTLYYKHHLPITIDTSGWKGMYVKWKTNNLLYKALEGHDTFYQYPRFSFMNTRWMTNGWHIFFMIVNFIIVAILYFLLLLVIFDILFSKLMNVSIYRIKPLGNGFVLFLTRLLLIIFLLCFIWFLGIIDLFIIVTFISGWDSLGIDIEMDRCPYCHSVGTLSVLGKSDKHTSAHNSDVTSRDVLVDQKHSEFTQSDGTRVHVTTNVMQKQSFRSRIINRRWKENYYCNACNRKVSYNKSETESHEVRVG